MINSDPAGNSPCRGRVAATLAVLTGCTLLAAIVYMACLPAEDAGVSVTEAPVKRAHGSRAELAKVTDRSPAAVFGELGQSPLGVNAPESEQPSDISTPKEWGGPAFRRFFAHDPEGSVELEAAYGRWRQANYPLAEKVAHLASERAGGATRKLWNRFELDAAIRWVGDLKDGETKFMLLAELGRRLFALDRAAAAALSGQLKPGLYRDAYLGEVVEEWAARDPEASSGWVESFPPGELRTALQMKVAVRSAEKTPATVAAYVWDLDAGPARDAAAQTVARHWALRDPRAAAEGVMSYPSEELRNDLLSTTIAYWSRSDAVGLQRWIQESPADPTRRAAAELLAKQLSTH